MPLANSTLHIRLLPGRKLQPGRKYTIEIYQENGLRAQVSPTFGCYGQQLDLVVGATTFVHCESVSYVAFL